MHSNANPANSAASNKGDILVVDDTPDNIRFLSAMLTDNGYFVRKAIDGRMALTAVDTRLPDLILLDINMPGLNGYEVCQHLKASDRTREIPVIFLSALDDAADKIKAFEVGGADYISKPFHFAEVLARIEHQLQIQRLQQCLQEQNAQLKASLSETQELQACLVQQEKMAALGQLVAGIAHEVNNPLTFISGNLEPAREYVADLLELLQRYQQEHSQPSEALKAAIAEKEPEFLAADLEALMSSIGSGVDRIRAIAIGLRAFSRLDEAPLKAIDLHEGLESTLLVLGHRLQPEGKPPVRVVKEYGDLPPFTCYASQINQVFLQLLNNALDAIEERQAVSETPFEPAIWIRTCLRENRSDVAIVRIGDNGAGTSEEARSRLFEPFFTTKPVGKGAGLGLWTSYQIVTEQHGGTLSCQPRSEGGTVFEIELLCQSDKMSET